MGYKFSRDIVKSYLEAIIMRIDFGSLAFGYSLESGTGTPNWATALGQGKQYKINNSDEINELVKGLVYSSVSLSKVRTKIGKGGTLIKGDEPKSPMIIAGVYKKVYVNNELINNGKFIIIATRDTSKSHFGRIRIKYGPNNSYTDGEYSFSNQDFFNAVRKQFSLSDNACWFVYDISIMNQDELILKSVFVDKSNQITYKNSSEMHDKWNKLIPVNCEFTIQTSANKTLQILYFGAPGTGKSYGVDRLISKFYPNINIKDNPFVFRTTVYSDYSYYNFIGNIMPTSKDGEIGYEFKAGVFTQALAMAFEHIDKEIFLVIEEMSRGDIASIFGDIFQLLDRDDSGISDYSINNDLVSNYLNEKNIDIGEKIYLPRNLHIIGTVNTSDQNVNVIDTAFKRRFEFVYVDVNPVKDDNDNFLNSFTFKLDDTEFEWNKFYMSLNELITTKLELSEDKQIGQFFIKFNNFGTDEQKLDEIKNKLLHYLWDDVQGAVISDECSIFKNEYKTFPSLYKAFDKGENVFSDELMNIYTRQSI